MAELKRLFSEWEFCGYHLKNRICVPPLVIYTWSDETGKVTDKQVHHYEELVNGGAGLVRQEATCVSETGRLTLDQLGIWNDEQKEGLTRIKDVLKTGGMPAILQLSHAGAVAKRPEDRVCPSPASFQLNGVQYDARELSVEEIQTIENQFIAAAKRAYDIGYDGVELHACHGYLLSQFMNHSVNRRTDAYRAEDNLLVENIIDGIRSVTSEDFIIGVRLGIYEPDLAIGLANAEWLEGKGVSYIEAYYGCDWAANPKEPEDFPFNPSIYAAKRVKEKLSIPVFTGFEITEGQQAEDILKETNADMVVLGRSHLVNPAWANHVAAGLDPGRCYRCATCLWKLAPDECPGRAEINR